MPRFEDVLELEGDDPATRQLQGMAWLSMSKARNELGGPKEALEAARDAERIMRRLIAENRLVDQATMALATALSYEGPILGQAGKFAEAMAALDESARLLEPRATEEAPSVLERLAHVHNNWGNCLRFGGGGTPVAFEAADAHYRTAVEIFGRAGRMMPSCRDWQARSLSNLALFVAESLKRPEEAAGLAQQAADLAGGLAREFPDELDSRECLASCLTNVGDIDLLLGRVEAARLGFNQALALYERLSLQVPENAEFRWSVAMAESNLGNCLMIAPGDDLARAGERLRRAEGVYVQLVKQSPENQDLANYAAINRQRIEALEAKGKPRP